MENKKHTWCNLSLLKLPDIPELELSCAVNLNCQAVILLTGIKMEHNGKIDKIRVSHLYLQFPAQPPGSDLWLFDHRHHTSL